jgi:hypothetical protein
MDTEHGGRRPLGGAVLALGLRDVVGAQAFLVRGAFGQLAVGGQLVAVGGDLVGFRERPVAVGGGPVGVSGSLVCIRRALVYLGESLVGIQSGLVRVARGLAVGLGL